MPPSVESAVYAFEALLPDLQSPPLAAQRALDHAGLRLAVEGWRSLPLEDRAALTIAGTADPIDTAQVTRIAQRATPEPQSITPIRDTDPAAPPDALAGALVSPRILDRQRWARLRAVDRYALAHAHRHGPASMLEAVYDAVFGAEGALSSHLNQAGEIHMVDVARKPITERRAVARGSVRMRADTLARLASRDAPKGEVLATARIAGVMAAKRTPEIIPLCHAVAVTHIEIVIEIDAPTEAVHVTAVIDAFDRTGCEMEAMVAVSAACLTIYDMLKGIDRDMVISDVKLMEKSGGRSGHYRRTEGAS